MIRLVLIVLLLAPRPASVPAPTPVVGVEKDVPWPSVAPERTAAPASDVAPVGGRDRTGSAAHELRGVASWYRTPGLTAAAGPALRRALGDWRGQHVTVCADRCVVVVLSDWCQCYKGERSERIIDLSDSAFAALAPLSSGLVRVTVAGVVPPRTDAP